MWLKGKTSDIRKYTHMTERQKTPVPLALASGLKTTDTSMFGAETPNTQREAACGTTWRSSFFFNFL